MKKEENLYTIEDEFEQIMKTTKEQIEKHPDEAERILMEYAHMLLRCGIADVGSVIVMFSEKLKMSDRELFKKYHLTNLGMWPRDQKEEIKIWTKSEW